MMRIEIEFGAGNGFGALKRWALLLLPLVAVAVVLWLWSRPILGTLSPFALAFVFAYLLNPAVDWISGERRRRFRIHRGFAILILFLFLTAVFLGVIAYIVPGIVRESAQFANLVRTEYFPQFRDSIQPKVDEWFSRRDLVKNGNFGQWRGEGLPTDWEVSSWGTARRAAEGDGGVLLETSGSDWVLRQELAGLEGGKIYTLEVESGPHTEGPPWRLFIWGGVKEDNNLAAKIHETILGGTEASAVEIEIPGETRGGAIAILGPATGETASRLRVESIRLLGPPPFPYFTVSYWIDWYEKNRERFTWASLSQVVTYGFRGAGVVAGGAGGIWTWMSSTLGGVISVAVYLSLILVIVFYMLLDFTAFKRSCADLVPENYRERFLDVMSEIDRSVGGFIRGQATVCLIVGLLVMISLLLIGVPFAILIGLGAGIFGFIPYLGPVMGLAPAVILTLLEFLDTGPDHTAQWVCIKLGLIVVSFLLIQMAEGLLISPKVMSESVDVPPLVVMGTLMLGGGIAGVTGMVLAIPAYCILRVLVSQYRKELSRIVKVTSSD